MSILKGILHHWNKTTKSYDTIHPETESAQITDWHQGIVNTLTSDSLLAKMIQKVFSAAGLKYNIEQNGYICFGKNFGGLILQWGNMSVGSGRTEAFSYPVTMSKVLFATANPISGSNGRENNRVVSPSSSECQVYNGSNDTSNMLILLLGLA
ncbi:gp53-like domain-containing protein [Mitsuokella jalaludinii]|uniref:gp53-like domain-containing protein n=1 Tax=Mitsuokella jalaludinii TaxID=187979 RepID=UPI0030772C3B